MAFPGSRCSRTAQPGQRPRREGPSLELLNVYLRNIGIPARAHQFRHWFGTEVYRQTLDLRLVGALLGHADLKTTAGYVALVPSPDSVAIMRSLTAHPKPAVI
jgi:site-specific recombinase XerD